MSTSMRAARETPSGAAATAPPEGAPARTTSLSWRCDASLMTVLLTVEATVSHTLWVGLQTFRFAKSDHLAECTFCHVDKPKALHNFSEYGGVSGDSTAGGKVEGMRGAEAKKSRVARMWAARFFCSICSFWSP
jgi:hypothetical protein